MDEIVKIKGGKAGLQLSFAPGASFEAIRRDIEEKLASGSGFFLRGTLVLLPQDRLSKDEQEELQKLFRQSGLICRMMTRERAKEKPVRTAQATSAPSAAQPAVQEMTIINRTLRGGQEIRTQSSVLVVGNVNPGAQIIEIAADAAGQRWLRCRQGTDCCARQCVQPCASRVRWSCHALHDCAMAWGGHAAVGLVHLRRQFFESLSIKTGCSALNACL